MTDNVPSKKAWYEIPIAPPAPKPQVSDARDALRYDPGDIHAMTEWGRT